MPSELSVAPLFRAAGDEDDEVAGLAAQALVGMGERVTDLIKTSLADSPLRDRIAAMRCLQARPSDDHWAIKPLLSAVGNTDDAAAHLAAQTLVEMGKDVQMQVLEVAQQSDHPLYQSGLAYLEEILGSSLVWVLSGSFLMGSDKDQDSQAYDDELPQHEVDLPGYWIGRYPVTVAQFRVFVEESGYEVHKRSLDDPADHPVRYVSWHDAIAYCRWLSGKTGLAVRLPSEAEWEKAARGTDGWIYPWGDERPTDDLCNFGDGKRGTTPVGRYSPQGDSPYGCADMAGNVWEWTQSLHDSYPYDSVDGREDLEADGPRVLRGGAFDLSTWDGRCAYRYGSYPYLRFRNYGVRVVVSPFL
jgi:formylglycine-generating enzyme required for sulfatase activity